MGSFEKLIIRTVGAPEGNKNAIKYNRKTVIRIMQRAIRVTIRDKTVFNLVELNKAVGLPNNQVLGYIVTKFRNDPGVMELCRKINEGLKCNLKLHFEKRGYLWEEIFNSLGTNN